MHVVTECSHHWQMVMMNPVAFCIHMRHSSKSRAMDCHTQWNQWNMTMQKSSKIQL